MQNHIPSRTGFQRSTLPGFRQPARLRGLTLIELLVVIAIIALLAAILFPAFARARENARRSSCLNNMKQIALGLLQYTQDYDERFPNFEGQGSTTNPSGVASVAYHVKVFPYVKSEQIFRCPNFRRPTSTGAPFANYQYPTYGMMGMDNTSCPGGPFTPSTGDEFDEGCTSTAPNPQPAERHIYDADGAHMSWLKAPAVTMMLAETAHSYARLYGAQSSSSWGFANTSTDNIAFGSPLTYVTDPTTGLGAHHIDSIAHFDGYNVAFADGHVKWVKAGGEQGYAFSIRMCDLSPSCQ